MTQIQTPLQVFLDSDGDALDNGQIYVGIANLNPETNPVNVYWDEDRTQLAAQPLRTSGGYIWRNGSAARIYIAADIFSVTVKDRNGLLIWSIPDATSLFTADSKLTQVATGFFYESDGARVNRMNDRLFIADATVNDGNEWSATPGAGGNQDYVSENIPQGPTTALAQLASLSTVGGIGVLGGTRSSDGAGLGTQGTLAVVGIAINDYTATPVITEAAYFEGQRKTDAGITQGVEIDTVNQADVVEWNPYKSLFTAATGYTFGLTIGAGGDRAGVVDSSAALSIINNGADFGKGIVFYSEALDSDNEAIVLAKDHKMQWYYGTNQNFATAASSTIGSNEINFSATAVTPYVGMVIVPSDGTATFPADTYITVVDSATEVHVSADALASTSGLTIAGLVGFPTNSIASNSTNTHQDSILFQDTGILLGSSPSTNGGLDCAGVLKLLPVTAGTNYVTVEASSGGLPQIATNGGALTVTSNTGVVNFAATGNYVSINYSASGDPFLNTNGGSLFLSSNTGAVKLGNTAVAPTLTVTTSQATVNPTVATPAGGSSTTGLIFGTTPGFGIYYGVGAPTLSAAQGSWYMRSDGSSTTTRMYINTNGSTTWTAVTTAA